MAHIIGYALMLRHHVSVVYGEGEYLIPFFPVVPVIFTWLIITGFFRTRDINKYIYRVFIIALISQPFYMYVFEKITLNIIFGFVLILLLLKVLDDNKIKDYPVIMIYLGLMLLLDGIIEAIFITMSSALVMYYLKYYFVDSLKVLHNIKVNKYFVRFFYPGHLIILAVLKYFL